MSKQALSFQQVILKLHQFWADQGCVIWEPYNVQLGAGTGNPATLLRVLGPEPWRVAYVEPSVRPDDGRFGENPNRMQKFYQYQVILKPDPGNPQEIYLESLEALGINPREHDIRFVEDNWESPALGAWGLGWEVWLDGQEITQFTYFQQAGGQEMEPVSVEITYGIERIVLALQDKQSAWDIDWMPGLQYRELFLQDEIDHCRYYFDIADVDAVKSVYDAYISEHERSLAEEALIPAYDYVLKCSHLFNVLDTRGAIGVTERATFFRKMREMTRNVASAYLEQRARLDYPMMAMVAQWGGPTMQEAAALPDALTTAADFLLEIGVEEMPPQDVDAAIAQLKQASEALFETLNLSHEGIEVMGTPRRLVLSAKGVVASQPDTEVIEKGPPTNRAFDADGKPTKAAQGFARSRGISVDDLTVEEIDDGSYVMAKVQHIGRPATHVLAEALPNLVAGIKFGRAMRWNESRVAFSRPLRWMVALFGGQVVPFTYAGIASGRATRGLRPFGSPEQTLGAAADYWAFIDAQQILLDRDARRRVIKEQIDALAAEVGGVIPDNPGLLDEVTNLVERPTALRGSFEARYLDLPRDVLVTVMRKHQRYFPVQDVDAALMPYFVAVRNGDAEHLDLVTAGNEAVLRARFADGEYFFNEDVKKPLAEYLPRLGTLTFEEHLGSMLEKNQRVAGLLAGIGDLLGMDSTEIAIAERAGGIAKADLATNMVVEMTSLQGTMGREYALREGYPVDVANAIFEHWQPRNADDSLPKSPAGVLLALTDRLDSLVGLFAAGLAPRSTADPYGLRRAALGVIQIAADKALDVDLVQAVNLTAAAQPIPVSDEHKAQVLEFIAGRLTVWLQDAGWAPDVVKAVLAAQSSNPHRALSAVQQLSAWVARPDWEGILDSFARCVRITRSEDTQYEVDPALFQEAEESALYVAYEQGVADLKADGDINAFLNAFLPMVPAVTRFFGQNPGEGVLVHTDVLPVRNNRVGLLQKISVMQRGRADLSQLSGF